MSPEYLEEKLRLEKRIDDNPDDDSAIWDLVAFKMYGLEWKNHIKIPD